MAKAKAKETRLFSISNLKPYEKNAKIHTKNQLDLLVKSIKEFGFVSPVLIDKDYNIIAGHGRVEAATLAGLKEIPCTFIEGFTEAQKKAYILADNRISELGEWNMDLVNAEINNLVDMDFDIDMTGFELPDVPIDDHEWYGDERKRTNDAYNLDIAHNTTMTDDFWQMPVIRNDNIVPERMIGFNYAKTSTDKSCGIHFFVDDYQFERIWNDPEKYIEVLKDYQCILTPDFSLYMDMPMPMKIWNIYRSRQIGAFYQFCGLKVIPTISWAEPETYEFCFRGIQEGAIVAVSTIGVKENKKALAVWEDGMKEMIKEIKPSKILLYGGTLEFEHDGIDVIYYNNEVLERWKK